MFTRSNPLKLAIMTGLFMTSWVLDVVPAAGQNVHTGKNSASAELHIRIYIAPIVYSQVPDQRVRTEGPIAFSIPTKPPRVEVIEETSVLELPAHSGSSNKVLLKTKTIVPE